MDRRTFSIITLKSSAIILIPKSLFAINNIDTLQINDLNLTKEQKKFIVYDSNYRLNGNSAISWNTIAKGLSMDNNLSNKSLVRKFNKKTKLKKKDNDQIINTIKKGRNDSELVIDSLKIVGNVLGVTVTAISLVTPIAPIVTGSLLLTGGFIFFHDLKEKSEISNKSKKEIFKYAVQNGFEEEDALNRIFNKLDFSENFQLNLDFSEESVNELIPEEIKLITNETSNFKEALNHIENGIETLNEDVNSILKKIQDLEDEKEKRLEFEKAKTLIDNNEKKFRAGATIFKILAEKFGVLTGQEIMKIETIYNSMSSITIATNLFKINKMSGIEMASIYLTAYTTLAGLMDNSPSPEEQRHKQIMEALQRIGEMIVEMHQDLVLRLNNIQETQIATLELLIDFYKDFTSYKIDSLRKLSNILDISKRIKIEGEEDSRDDFDQKIHVAINKLNFSMTDEVLRSNTNLWRTDYYEIISIFTTHGLELSKTRLFSCKYVSTVNYDVLYDDIIQRKKIELLIGAIKQVYTNGNLSKLTFTGSLCNPREWARSSELILQSQLITKKFHNNSNIIKTLNLFLREGEKLKYFFNSASDIKNIGKLKIELIEELKNISLEIEQEIIKLEEEKGFQLFQRLPNKFFNHIHPKEFKTFPTSTKKFFTSYLYAPTKSGTSILTENDPVLFAEKIGILQRENIAFDTPGLSMFLLQKVKLKVKTGIFKDFKFDLLQFKPKEANNFQVKSEFHKEINNFLNKEELVIFNNYVKSRKKESIDHIDKESFLFTDLIGYMIEEHTNTLKNNLIETIINSPVLLNYNRRAIPFFLFSKINHFCQMNDDNDHYIELENSIFSRKGLENILHNEIFKQGGENQNPLIKEHFKELFEKIVADRAEDIFLSCIDLENKSLIIIDETILKLKTYLSLY